jgi:hypothetical protein
MPKKQLGQKGKIMKNKASHLVNIDRISGNEYKGQEFHLSVKHQKYETDDGTVEEGDVVKSWVTQEVSLEEFCLIFGAAMAGIKLMLRDMEDGCETEKKKSLFRGVINEAMKISDHDYDEVEKDNGC